MCSPICWPHYAQQHERRVLRKPRGKSRSRLRLECNAPEALPQTQQKSKISFQALPGMQCTRGSASNTKNKLNPNNSMVAELATSVSKHKENQRKSWRLSLRVRRNAGLTAPTMSFNLSSLKIFAFRVNSRLSWPFQSVVIRIHEPTSVDLTMRRLHAS